MGLGNRTRPVDDRRHAARDQHVSHGHGGVCAHLRCLSGDLRQGAFSGLHELVIGLHVGRRQAQLHLVAKQLSVEIAVLRSEFFQQFLNLPKDHLRPGVGIQTSVEPGGALVRHRRFPTLAADFPHVEGRSTPDRVARATVRQVLQSTDQPRHFLDGVHAQLRRGRVRGTTVRPHGSGQTAPVPDFDPAARRFAHNSPGRPEVALLEERKCSPVVAFFAHLEHSSQRTDAGKSGFDRRREGHHHPRHRALGVASPAAVDFAVAKLGGKRVDGHALRPLCVEMRVQDQYRLSSPNLGHHTGPVGTGGDQFRLDATLRVPVAHGLRNRQPFPAGDARNSHEASCQLNGFPWVDLPPEISHKDLSRTHWCSLVGNDLAFAAPATSRRTLRQGSTSPPGAQCRRKVIASNTRTRPPTASAL